MRRDDLWVAATVAGALAFVLLAPDAKAQTIGLHLGSHHTERGYCGANPGAYYRSRDGWTVGAYRNSECRRWSAYAGRTWEYEFPSRWALAGTAGVVTGYRRAAALPMVVPSLRTPYYRNVALRVAYLPRLGGMPETWHLTIERRFQ
jgi:hypothetical protein